MNIEKAGITISFYKMCYFTQICLDKQSLLGLSRLTTKVVAFLYWEIKRYVFTQVDANKKAALRLL